MHTIRSFIDTHSAEENLCCLKIDITNAFNECNRNAFLHRLHKDLRDLFSWAVWSYQCAGELCFGKRRLLSKAGVQQGDPLGPLLFSLVLLELLDDIAKEVAALRLQLWYLDDGTFIGERSSVVSVAFSAIQGSKIWSLLELKKCEVFWPTGNQTFPEFPPEVQRVAEQEEGIELLGSPIYGNEEFFESAFQKRISKVINAQSHLMDIDDPQIEFQLFRSCLSLPKINHLLRTVPPGKALCQLSSFDKHLCCAFELLSHSSLSNVAWKQAFLPIKYGGLGLRLANRASCLAFIGSCNSTRKLVCRFLGVSSIDEATYENVQIDTDINVASQHSLQSQVDKWDFDLLKESCFIRDKARLNTISEPHAGAWLTAIPNPNLGLAMSRHESTIAVHLWLGLPLFSSPPNAVRCICGQVLDKFGDHLFGCRKISLHSRCHNALRDVIFQALLVHDKGTRREQRSSSENYSRSGDVYHSNFLFSRLAYFDVTVCNSFQQRFVLHSAPVLWP